MDLASKSAVVEALRRVGELLEAEGYSYAIAILGGAALNVLGIVERPTTDVDILAFAEPSGSGPRVLQTAGTDACATDQSRRRGRPRYGTRR